jgi:hypothetical protein
LSDSWLIPQGTKKLRLAPLLLTSGACTHENETAKIQQSKETAADSNDALSSLPNVLKKDERGVNEQLFR